MAHLDLHLSEIVLTCIGHTIMTHALCTVLRCLGLSAIHVMLTFLLC